MHTDFIKTLVTGSPNYDLIVDQWKFILFQDLLFQMGSIQIICIQTFSKISTTFKTQNCQKREVHLENCSLYFKSSFKYSKGTSRWVSGRNIGSAGCPRGALAWLTPGPQDPHEGALTLRFSSSAAVVASLQSAKSYTIMNLLRQIWLFGSQQIDFL